MNKRFAKSTSSRFLAMLLAFLMTFTSLGFGSLAHAASTEQIMPVTGRNFTVYVKDTEGNPVPGATVKLTRYDKPEFTFTKESNSEGVAAFTDLVSAVYYYEIAEAPVGYDIVPRNYRASWPTESEDADRVNDPLLLKAWPTQSEETVTGTFKLVEALESGERIPVEGLQVNITSPIDPSVNETLTTDADGLITFTGLMHEDYTLNIVTEPDFEPVAPIRWKLSEPTLNEQWPLVRKPAPVVNDGTARVYVKDQEGYPVSDATVRLTLDSDPSVTLTAKTDTQGGADFADMVRGAYTAEVTEVPSLYTLGTDTLTFNNDPDDVDLANDPLVVNVVELKTTGLQINTYRFVEGQEPVLTELFRNANNEPADYTLVNTRTGATINSNAINSRRTVVSFNNVPAGTYTLTMTLPDGNTLSHFGDEVNTVTGDNTATVVVPQDSGFFTNLNLYISQDPTKVEETTVTFNPNGGTFTGAFAEYGTDNYIVTNQKYEEVVQSSEWPYDFRNVEKQNHDANSWRLETETGKVINNTAGLRTALLANGWVDTTLVLNWTPYTLTIDTSEEGVTIDEGENVITPDTENKVIVPYRFSTNLSKPGYTLAGYEVVSGTVLVNGEKVTELPKHKTEVVLESNAVISPIWTPTGGKVILHLFEEMPLPNRVVNLVAEDGTQYPLTSKSSGAEYRDYRNVDLIPNGTYTLVIDGVTADTHTVSVNTSNDGGSYFTTRELTVTDNVPTLTVAYEDDQTTAFVRVGLDIVEKQDPYTLTIDTSEEGVTIKEDQGVYTADADGTVTVPYQFTTELAKPGYTLAGYEVVSGTVLVNGEKVTELPKYKTEVVLESNAVISPIWTLTGGKVILHLFEEMPLPNRVVNLVAEDGTQYPLTSKSSGAKYREYRNVDLIPNGTYTLVIDGVTADTHTVSVNTSNDGGSYFTSRELSVTDNVPTLTVAYEDNQTTAFVRVGLNIELISSDLGVEVRDLDNKRTDALTVEITDAEGTVFAGEFNQYTQYILDKLVPGKYTITLSGLPQGTQALINPTVATQKAVATDEANVFTIEVTGEETGRVWGAFKLVEIYTLTIDTSEEGVTIKEDQGVYTADLDGTVTLPYQFTTKLAKPGYTLTGYEVVSGTVLKNGAEVTELTLFKQDITITSDVVIKPVWEDTKGGVTLVVFEDDYITEKTIALVAEDGTVYAMDSNSYSGGNRTYRTVEDVPAGVYTITIDGVTADTHTVSVNTTRDGGSYYTTRELTVTDNVPTLTVSYEDDKPTAFVRLGLELTRVMRNYYVEYPVNVRESLDGEIIGRKTVNDQIVAYRDGDYVVFEEDGVKKSIYHTFVTEEVQEGTFYITRTTNVRRADGSIAYEGDVRQEINGYRLGDYVFFEENGEMLSVHHTFVTETVVYTEAAVYTLDQVNIRDANDGTIIGLSGFGQQYEGKIFGHYFYFTYEGREARMHTALLSNDEPVLRRVTSPANIRDAKLNLVGRAEVGDAIFSIRVGDYYRYWETGQGVRLIWNAYAR